jgi:hypothetical protein
MASFDWDMVDYPWIAEINNFALFFMKNDFLNRIILERDYKITLLRENLESGYLDADNLFRYLNEIATLQYRFFGHSDIINVTEQSTVDEKLKSSFQSFFVLEKSISFIDGMVAALSSNSINRHLLNPYYGRTEDTPVRDKIIVSGHNEILKIYGSIS